MATISYFAFEDFIEDEDLDAHDCRARSMPDNAVCLGPPAEVLLKALSAEPESMELPTLRPEDSAPVHLPAAPQAYPSAHFPAPSPPPSTTSQARALTLRAAVAALPCAAVQALPHAHNLYMAAVVPSVVPTSAPQAAPYTATATALYGSSSSSSLCSGAAGTLHRTSQSTTAVWQCAHEGAEGVDGVWRATAVAAPPPAPPPAPRLLATCPATPPAMQRPVWRLSDYHVTRQLFTGPTSTVYKATCLSSGLPVALKVYDLTRVPHNVHHMLHREVAVQAPLVHPHIAMLYGAFEDERHLVLVQELAANGALVDLASLPPAAAARVPAGLLAPPVTHGSRSGGKQGGGRFCEGGARDLVLRPLLSALAYLHARGICHRDIKPDNLLFASDWRLLLCDFGVAIDLRLERAVTRAGTEGYMAPEVCRCPLKAHPSDNKEDAALAYTTAVDVWATGALAYAMLTGRRPVAGSGRTALPFPPSAADPMRDFVGWALQERPEDRPTAVQLLHHAWAQGRCARRCAAAAEAELEGGDGLAGRV